jgi:hypothetical protein
MMEVFLIRENSDDKIYGKNFESPFFFSVLLHTSIRAFILFCSQGYMLRNWYSLSLATSVPFILLFSYYWIIPESPRWLLSKNRIDEAEVIVQSMAKMNGKTVPTNFLRKMEVQLTPLAWNQLRSARSWCFCYASV